MSGVFMDGGSGGDGGGGGGGHHSSHGGGGDGGSFMDGGGHDHGHHGHATHSGGGDGGNFLNHVLGYNNNTGHHSFLSHLLGLDHDAHHHGGHGDGGHDHGHDGSHGDGGQNPSQTPIWTSALQGMKLSHALEGIKVSINVWFFFFYMMCIFWLFLVYWIRHHEPLANGVLGRGAAKYETAAADRRIIDNCRDATPIRTSQNQACYAPMPAEFHDPSAQQAIKAAAFNANTANQPYFAPTNFVPPNPTPAVGVPGGMAAPSGAGTRDMASFYNQSTPFGAPIGAAPVIPFQAIPNANGPGHMIATPMPLAPGSQRLKMIINR
ncbi:hypothetical protein BH10CYA1_BH10CYA1_34240 [soil metagenome]